jgi:Family of unknown function (DUF6448)
VNHRANGGQAEHPDQCPGPADGHELFFETVVRIHRAGEGAPYTGLKPSGTPVSPVIPIAEEAIATGSTDRLTTYLIGVLQDELNRRLSRVSTLVANKDRSVADARRYVEAMLDLRCTATRCSGH